MKKYIALILALIFGISLVGCAENAVLDEVYVYRAESDIHSLEIQIGAADFIIKPADTISVESNLKYLSISEKNGVLSIMDERTVGVTYDNPILTLYMPTEMVYEDIDISTGAAKLTADVLSAKSLELKLGAGDVSIRNIRVVEEADIEGGAGKITIAGGVINNLELQMGVGELNMTSVLHGDNDLVFGVGESNLTLIGSRNDYKIDIEKGLGSVTVEGENAADFGDSGNGRNRVQIEGGVGTINLKFCESGGQ